jgi:hypothetical protein
MQKLIPVMLLISLSFNSCRNKTVVLLNKKWDCVQVENNTAADPKFSTPKDSADAEQLSSILLSLKWTFKDRMKYTCELNGKEVVQGRYELLEDDKVMICTPDSKAGVSRYIIKSLSDNELVLNGTAATANLVLHFKPN